MSGIPERLRSAMAHRYPIERQIGSGGMAIVYLAHDLKLDRAVAVKVLRSEYAGAVGADRFLREIDIAAKMNHPHILPLYDCGEADGFLYYVMPYVEGESLRDRLWKEKQLPVEDAIQVACQVADALSCAHSHGVLHRDIKPANILLEHGEAVVTDFGIARAITAAVGDTLTASGIVVGTPQYMSPEQGCGERDLDERTDIYALGCVLFEMLAGEPPFTGRTAQAIIARTVSERPPSLRVVRPEVPPWLERVVHTALAKNPADRFQTAESFSKCLRGRAAPRSGLRPIFKGRRRVAVGLAIAAAITAVIVTKVLNLRIEHGPASIEVASVLDPTRIAVLPFDDQSQRGDFGHLALAFPQYLIDQLSGLDALKVAPYAAVRPYLHSDAPLDSVISKLRAGTIVEGAIVGSEEYIRVIVRLTDANELAIIHSSPHQRPRGETLALLDDLTNEVAAALRRKLGVVIRDFERRAGTDSDEAWELYAHGREWAAEAKEMWQAGADEAALQTYDRADSTFARAQAMDPAWVDPIVERGWLTAEKARIVRKHIRIRDPAMLRRGIELAELALELDPRNARALDLRGSLRYWLRETANDTAAVRLREGAEQDLRAAVEIEPGNAHAWHMLSNTLRVGGKLVEAMEAAGRALAADDFYEERETIFGRLCQMALELQDWDMVTSRCEAGRREFFRNRTLINTQLTALASAGGPDPDVDRAWQLFEELLEFSPPQSRAALRPSALLHVSAVLARAGRDDSAKAVIRQARAAESEPDPMTDYYEAYVRLQLGEKDEALRLLRRHLEARPANREYIADIDWWWEPLRNDPGFLDVVK